MKQLLSVFIGLSFILWLQPAYAYIDPGSGSAIMSAIIGFFVAIGLIIKTYWYKFKSFFSAKDRSSKNSASQDSTEKEIDS